MLRPGSVAPTMTACRIRELLDSSAADLIEADPSNSSGSDCPVVSLSSTFDQIATKRAIIDCVGYYRNSFRKSKRKMKKIMRYDQISDFESDK
jgi:hypothetical protein